MALTTPTLDLTGETIATTYKQLLFIDGAAITNSALFVVACQDGETALRVANDQILIKDSSGTDIASLFEVQDKDANVILSVDGVNNRIGIGTAAPVVGFHAQGAGVLEHRIESTDNDCSLQIASHTNETKSSILGFNSAATTRGSIVYDHNTVQADQKMQFIVGDGAITAATILGNGNVGIGIAAPTSLLHLAATEPYIHFDGTHSDGDYKIGTGDGNLYFTDASTSIPSMTINDANVGIGTASPLDVLHIEKVGASTSILTLSQNSAATPQVVEGNFLGQIKFGGHDQNITDGSGSGSHFAYGAAIRALADGNDWANSNQYFAPTSLCFYVQDTTTSNTIDTTAMIIQYDGNVGIGTPAPDVALAVIGKAFVGDVLSGVNEATFQVHNTGSQPVLAIGGKNTASAEDIGASLHFCDTAMQIAYPRTKIVSVQTEADPDQQGLAFYTHPTTDNTGAPIEQMRISALGNVGIGTTTSTAPLSIQSNTSLTNASTEALALNHMTSGTPAANLGVRIGFHADENDSSPVQLGNINVAFSGDPTSSDDAHMVFSLNKQGTGVRELVRINTDGNVGIGEASPQTALHITNAAPTLRLNRTTGSSGSIGRIDFGVDDDDQILSSIRGENDSDVDSSKLMFSTSKSNVESDVLEFNEDGDANFKDNYIVNEQGRQVHVANTMSAPFYRFNRENDNKIDFGSSSDWNPGAGDFSMVWEGRVIDGTDDNDKYFLAQYQSGTTYFEFGLSGTFNLSFGRTISGSVEGNYRSAALTSWDDKIHHIVFVSDRDGVKGQFYLDGEAVATTEVTPMAASLTPVVGSVTTGFNGANFSQQDTTKIAYYNSALSAEEVKELYSGGEVHTSQPYTGETLWNNEAQHGTFTTNTMSYIVHNSGTFLPVYSAANDGSIRITSDTGGARIDATNHGRLEKRPVKVTLTASMDSGTGTLRIAADLTTYTPFQTITTTPTTYTFNVTSLDEEGYLVLDVVQVSKIMTIDNITFEYTGCLAKYDGSSAGQGQWRDKSGRGNHGTVTLAELQNQPAYEPVGDNILTNSGFGVWSNSALANVGSDLITNGGFASDTAGWTASVSTLASIAGGYSGNCLEMTRTGDSMQNAYQVVALTIGKLYKVTAYVKTGSSGNEAFFFGSQSDSVFVSGETTGSWVQHSVVFQAKTASNQIRIAKNTATVGTMLFDSITCHEVQPACVAASSLAPDGWHKTSTLDVYRESQNTANMKGMYGVRIEKGHANIEELMWPLSNTYGQESHWNRFKGKTVTFGAWIYTDSPLNARLYLRDASGYSYSTSGPGGYAPVNTLTWLEVTRTVPDEAWVSGKFFYAACSNELDSSDVTYMSEPMMVFGNHIGEGNYSRPEGEIIEVEDAIAFTGTGDYWSGALAAGVDTDLDLEGESAGMLPKGCAAILAEIIAQPNAAAGKFVAFRHPGGYEACVVNASSTYSMRSTGWTTCNTTNEVNLFTSTTTTWAGVSILAHAVKLK